MSRSILDDAFAHHVWATSTLIEACGALTDEQLAAPAPGTYGSILETQRHLVGADASYLFVTSGEREPVVDTEAMSLRDLGAVMERHREAWARVVAAAADPDRVLVRHRDDGSETHAPIGVRLAQALHHGSDHRSQICTALTSLGVEPPDIDVWDFAHERGRLLEVPAPS